MSYPTYAPDFAISVNGDAMPAAVRAVVTGVRFQEGENASDRVEVELANPNLRWLQKHIRGLGFQPFPTGVKIGPVRAGQVVPEGVFDIDNKLELAMGYAQRPLERLFEGDVTGVEASFPNGGMPTMKLVAHDYLQRLTEGTHAGGFGILPDFLQAAIISARNLLIPLIDPTVAALSLASSAIDLMFKATGTKQGARGEGETDLQYIERLAAKYDANFWVEGDVFYLSRFIKEYQPRLTLTWGESLTEFSPRMSAVGQVAGVSAKFSLREIKLCFLVSVFWDFDRETLGTRIVPGLPGSFGPVSPSLTILDKSISSPADIGKSSMELVSKLRKKLNKRLTGSGSAIGDPRIRAGAIIRLEGLGPDFSGNYRVASATHSIDASGYRTNFEVYKEVLP